MTNVMKKISALLLSFALIMTMMPLLAAEVNAEGTKAFGVKVNGVDIGEVTRERLLEGDICTNIYPFPSKQGGNWNYAVAKGVPYASIVKESLGIDDFSAVPGAIISWQDENGEEQGKGNGNFPVDKLESATTIFKLVDENEADITGSFDGKTPKDAKAVARVEAGSTTPIISTVSKKGYTYDEAVDAKEGFGPETEGATTTITPFVGGDLSDESQNYLKKDGKVNAQSFNFLGKYAIEVKNSNYSMNLKLAAPETLDMSFDSPKASPQDLVLGYDLSGEILNKLIEGAEWTSSNPEVAKVENGKVVPVATGTATITAKFPAANNGVTGTIKVNVKGETPAPTPDVKDGQTATVGGNGYKVLSAKEGTAVFTKAANKKSVSVPATVTVNGKTLKVTQIGANAFKGKKIRTVTVGKNVKKIAKNAFKGSKATKMIVKTKSLKKASVKGSLKGSKIKTVQVKVGKKKENKKYVKKYKKIFTKKNAGKKVKFK